MLTAWLKQPLEHTRKTQRINANVVLPFTPAETVLNLSTTRLSDVELEISKDGLKHSIEPLYINKTDVLTTFDFIHRSMSKRFEA